jgi:hypothetical protein
MDVAWRWLWRRAWNKLFPPPNNHLSVQYTHTHTHTHNSCVYARFQPSTIYPLQMRASHKMLGVLTLAGCIIHSMALRARQRTINRANRIIPVKTREVQQRSPGSPRWPQLGPGMAVVQAYNPKHLEGWGRRISWTQKLEAKIERPHSQSNKRENKQTQEHIR